tara:strand:- start:3781 stop:3936 length:156 start_codon:yes stop_codon:yes gene_type:complete
MEGQVTAKNIKFFNISFRGVRPFVKTSFDTFRQTSFCYADKKIDLKSNLGK